MVLIVATLQTSAQRFEVSGTVTDAISKEPLAGASVKIKNSSTVVITDVNGKFTINTNSLHETLVFTYVGFTAGEVPVNGRRSVNMQLEPESEALKSVIALVTSLLSSVP